MGLQLLFKTFFIYVVVPTMAIVMVMGSSWTSAVAAPKSVPTVNSNVGAPSERSAAMGSGTFEQMKIGTQHYNELSDIIFSKRYVGGRDEDSLQVQKDIAKPQRGSAGQELESQTAVDDHSSSDE